MRKSSWVIIVILLVIILFWLFPIQQIPDHITYGVSFSKFHSDELKLDWKETYLSILDDLKVRHFRFSAHWPNTEPKENQYNFKELDFQMQEAQKRGADVILGVGRRLPGWPECHDPEWIVGKEVSFREEKILEYVETVVTRYRDYPNLKYWQFSNEPFLRFFSRSQCGELNEEFFERAVGFVRKLDPKHPVLLTDSGEFGYWYQAYTRSDVFGTSLYLYIWNRYFGPMRYPIGPWFFVIKKNLVELFFHNKPSILIELSAEPWLLQPIITAPMEVLLERMGIDKFNEMIDFASKTGFDEQYLWGAEWWYWMKQHGHPEFWERAKQLFK